MTEYVLALLVAISVVDQEGKIRQDMDHMTVITSPLVMKDSLDCQRRALEFNAMIQQVKNEKRSIILKDKEKNVSGVATGAWCSYIPANSKNVG